MWLLENFKLHAWFILNFYAAELGQNVSDTVLGAEDTSVAGGNWVFAFMMFTAQWLQQTGILWQHLF